MKMIQWLKQNTIEMMERYESFFINHTKNNLKNFQDDRIDNESLMIMANTEGKLYPKRQVEDYILRGLDFEDMGFLSFIVETYEWHMGAEEMTMEEDSGDGLGRPRNQSSRYLSMHPKSAMHTCVLRSANHHFLPNIMGPWFPHRDDEERKKNFYYAAMLALLKPWRDLQDLKTNSESWETAFSDFLQNASQRDRDVIAGSEYYYKSRSVVTNRDGDEQKPSDVDEEDDEDIEVDHRFEEEVMNSVVNFIDIVL